MSAIAVATPRPPFAPGVYHDVPIGDYHGSGFGISKSGLDDIDRCPALYYARHLDPQREPERERAGQLEGNLAHCAILEPHAFAERYVTVPAGAPRRPTDAQWNAAKPSPSSVEAMKWWTEFADRVHGKTVITAAQHSTALQQAASVRRLPEAAKALGFGRAETSAFWIDQATGELCRCRPDWTHDCGSAGVVLFDVKTFANAAPDEFARQVARKRYHVQAAWYSDGYAIASGRTVLGFVFVAVETEYPYLANLLMLDELSLEHGRAAYRRNLDTYARCNTFEQWPGYGESIALISLPRWITSKEIE